MPRDNLDLPREIDTEPLCTYMRTLLHLLGIDHAEMPEGHSEISPRIKIFSFIVGLTNKIHDSLYPFGFPPAHAEFADFFGAARRLVGAAQKLHHESLTPATPLAESMFELNRTLTSFLNFTALSQDFEDGPYHQARAFALVLEAYLADLEAHSADLETPQIFEHLRNFIARYPAPAPKSENPAPQPLFVVVARNGDPNRPLTLKLPQRPSASPPAAQPLPAPTPTFR